MELLGKLCFEVIQVQVVAILLRIYKSHIYDFIGLAQKVLKNEIVLFDGNIAAVK